MSLSKLSALIEHISGCEEEELEQACNRLSSQCQTLDQQAKIHCLCFEATMRESRLRDPIAAGEILERALKLAKKQSIWQVEVLARMALNKFIQKQYHQSLQLHRKALAVSENLHFDTKDFIMGIYTKERNIFDEQETSDQSLGLLSIVYQVNGEKRRAYDLEIQAGKLYEKNHKPERKKFSNFRTARLSSLKQPELAYEVKKDFDQRSSTVKQLFQFYNSIESPEDQLNEQKRQIIQRLTAILQHTLQSDHPEDRKKAQKLRDFIDQLQQQKLPMTMMNSSQLLPPPTRQFPEIPRLNIPTSREDIRMQQSKKFPSTTSRYVSNEAWEGSELIKVNFGSEGEEKRYFYMKEGKDRLYYCSKKSKKSKEDEYYSLKGLQGIKKGKMTQTMRRKDNDNKDQSLCFSMEFPDRTRDFYALDKYDYAMWVDKLNRYIKSLTDKKKSTARLAQSTIRPESSPSGMLMMSKKL